MAAKVIDGNALARQVRAEYRTRACAEIGIHVGDVDFEGVSRKASYITKVHGGVGPMTVTMRLGNTVRAAERTLEQANHDRSGA